MEERIRSASMTSEAVIDFAECDSSASSSDAGEFMSFSSACFIHDTEAKVNNLLLKAAANDLLQRWSVSKRVNSWRAARRRDANSTTELAPEADVRFRGQSGDQRAPV